MARQLVTHAVEVRVEDTVLTQLLNPKFVEGFRESFPDAKFVQLRMAIPKGPEPGESGTGSKSKKRPRYEPVSVGHYLIDHDTKRLLTVECEDHDTLEAMERIIANLPVEEKQ